MKKTISISIGAFIVGILLSPFIGMAIGPTRDLILGMAPEEAILVLADKIDQEAGKNNEQEEKLSELNNTTTQQAKELAILNKNQEVLDCQKRKENCESKIYELENGELQINRPGVWKGSRTEMIKKLQEYIEGWEKNKKESADHKEILQDSIDNAEKEITKIEDAIKTEAIAKNNLLAGDCKDYQNPCE